MHLNQSLIFRGNSLVFRGVRVLNVSQPVRFEQNVFPSKNVEGSNKLVSPQNGDERSIDLKVIFFGVLLGPGKFSGAVKLPERIYFA